MQNLSKGQIDIHGLHVAEMISCMEEMINYFGSGPRRNSPLRVITGSGHHTEGPQRGEAKLLPALVQYCIELQINHSYILDPKGIKCGLILKFL